MTHDLGDGRAIAAMTYPVRCTYCGGTYDLAKVEVTARYTDCSMWKAPCCGLTVDDRGDTGWKSRKDYEHLPSSPLAHRGVEVTHDLGDRPDPDVATPGRWRKLVGSRRESRAAAVAPVEPTEVDGTPREWALAKQAWDAEMLLNRALALVDERLPQAKDRKHQNDLLDLKNLLSGKAK